jgi:hypothetical protein
MFDDSLPDTMSEDQVLKESYKNLEEQGGHDSKLELYRSNPVLFRNFKYSSAVSPDVLNPRSEDLERQFMLEEYDRAITNPILDQEQVTRDFLLGAYRKSKQDPDKYIKKQDPAALQIPGMQQMLAPGQQVPPQAQPAQQAKPQQSQQPQKLPQTPSVGRVG